MFRITQDFSRKQQGRGFQTQFSNEVVVSVQFGYGTYCTNRDGDMTTPSGDTVSPNAEVALFKEDDWLTQEALKATGIDKDPGDDVFGYATPEQVALLMAWACMYGRNKKSLTVRELE